VATADGGAPVTFEGAGLHGLMKTLDEVEKYLAVLERRGLSVAGHLARMKDDRLPHLKVVLGNREHWFFTAEEADAFRQEQLAKGKHLLVPGEAAADGDGQANGDGRANGNGHGDVFLATELHEVKHINEGLAKLRAVGLRPADLVPAPRVAGREPAPRIFLEVEGKQLVLAHLRVLVAEVRKAGERGMKITRFKGLGEMDGDELWATTLDPEHRTLLQVRLDDALKADEMFRKLMGEIVEPRRKFIADHAKEVTDLDYHGA
jgi:DNA gyrase subunit B